MKRFLFLSLLLIVSTSSFAAITDNLVLYLPYDEGAGGITHDLSGNGFDGKLFTQADNQVNKWAQPVNDNHWTSGKWGYAIKFYDGTFQRNDAPGTIQKAIVDSHILGKGIYVEPWADNPSLGTKYAQDWSYSFWVKRPTTRSIYNLSSWVNAWDVQPAKVLTDNETCVDLWQSGDLRYDHLHTRYNQDSSGSGRYLWTGFSAGGSTEEDNIGFALGTGPNGNGQWVNIIMLVDGYVGADNMLLSVYVNGALASKIITSNGGWGYIPTEVFTMGSTTLKGIDQNDDIDDVGVWNRILTPSEISWLQTNPIKPTLPLPPVLVSPVNQGTVNPNGILTWQAGPSGPFDSYDVYLGTNFDEVDSAKNILCSDLEGDVDNDCDVDIQDLDLIAACWLQNSSCNVNADLLVSPTIDFSDYSVMAGEWKVTGSPSYKGRQTGLSYSFSDLTVNQTYYWRIDGVKNGVGISKGNVRSFVVAATWRQTEWVNMMGWTDIEVYRDDLRIPYVQTLYDMGIRQAMNPSTAIQYCTPVGMKMFLYHNPTTGAIATQYKTNPTNVGFFQFDEPGQSDWPNVAIYHNECRAADPSRPSYTNLKSSQANGISGYPSYVDQYINTVNPHVLSFDCYPYRYGFEHHWASLDIARTKALAKGIPLWNWHETNQGGGTGGYVGSDLNRRRLHLVTYTSLAYGVKGISWWGISKVIVNNGGGFANSTYTIGDAYYDVQAINAEMNNIGPVMVGLNSQNVYHTNSVSGYTVALLPGDFWIQIANSDSGFVLGTFKDASNVDYAMVCNKSDGASVNNKQITFKQQVSSVLMFNEGTGGWDGQPIYGSYPNQYVQISMGPGYGKLLKIIKP